MELSDLDERLISSYLTIVMTTGATLYGCGFIMRRIENWANDRPGQA